MTLLLLAGTSEARRLAEGLAERQITAIASLSGATRAPAPLALPTRHGGFGGDKGFASYLEEHRITAVIDATHPFASRITARTYAVCTSRALSLLRLDRPSWVPGDGDRWTFAANEAEAMRLIPRTATVFLATGRQSLPAWEGLCAKAVHLRVIDPAVAPFPFPGGYVIARPPFDPTAEAVTLSRLGITHLVVKDSGAAEGRAKLDAARDLGVEVIVLRRPIAPAGLPTVCSAAEALSWAVALSFRPA